MISKHLIALSITAACATAQAVDFKSEVWPILEARCIKCHGEDQQKGDLRLDQPDAFIQEMSFSVLEHSPEEASLLLERITLPEGHEDRMPPKGDRLTSQQMQNLRDWITSGADFNNWTGVPPKPKRTPEWINAKLSNLNVTEDTIPSKIEFNRDIRPILSNNCYKCHGFDKNKREAKTRSK